MRDEESKEIWSAYHQRKKTQRIEEAVALWDKMLSAGVTEETVLALDFLFFGASRPDVEALTKQLSENYGMEILPAKEAGYWYAKGTTRPQGVTLTRDQYLGWVEFMSDVAQSYACVFSTWSLESPALNLQFFSEHVESAS
jgi:hypothetical protein